MNNNPIGIIDSGLGGLTILKEVTTLLPQETLVYLGDSKNVPYGRRSAEQVYELAKRLINFLLKKNVKLIVIACNTITVSCLDRLRHDYPHVPIVGTVPVIKTAATLTQNKRIGILSTTGTAQSDYQKNLITQFAGDCKVFNHGTDLLVPFIERGELDGESLDHTLNEVLAVFKSEEIDMLALGCTHFPFLRNKMQAILGKDVSILDSGAAIARQVKRVLENNSALSTAEHAKYEFYTTGNPEIANKLLAVTIKWKSLPAFSSINL